MNNLKTFKRGEILLKEGQEAKTIYLIQSGKVGAQVLRGKQTVDLYQLVGIHVVGEQALFGAALQPESIVAISETKAIEVPVELLAKQVEDSSQLVKLLNKSLGDKLKIFRNEVKNARLERSPLPCAPENIAKLFGVLFHSARHLGKLEAAPSPRVVVDWRMLRLYAQRIFHEPSERLDSAIKILVKLKLAEQHMVKVEEPDEDDLESEGREELGQVHLLDLPRIERFFEYYQYYSAKSGKGEFLITNTQCLKFVSALLKISEGVEADRNGAVRIPFGAAVERLKADYGLVFNDTYIGLLEMKGLLLNRTSRDEGVFFAFDVKEFRGAFENWEILREIELWNEKGVVDMNPEEAAKPVQAAAFKCSSCSQEAPSSSKFCPNCGVKLAA
jgi:hypothetical protein